MADDAVDGGDERVSVGLEAALEVLDGRARHDGQLAEVDRAARAVDGDEVALAEDGAAGRLEPLVADVHQPIVGAGYSMLAHAAGDDGSIARLASAAGEDG